MCKPQIFKKRESSIDIDIISLFPEYFLGPFDESILKRARQRGMLNINHVDVRWFGIGKHKRVDDRPYGGGAGMLLMCEPLEKAIKSVRRERSHVVYLSAQGKLLDAQKCRQLASHEHLILLCGHYEGIDDRIVQGEVNEEISIGNYVLTNGALAAIVIVDAVARFVPGVLGDHESCKEESFEEGMLEYPQYTQPLVFQGRAVPEVLLSGHHGEIAKWRREEALKKTKKMRPDLVGAFEAIKD